jgi:hypothetical protein
VGVFVRVTVFVGVTVTVMVGVNVGVMVMVGVGVRVKVMVKVGEPQAPGTLTETVFAFTAGKLLECMLAVLVNKHAGAGGEPQMVAVKTMSPAAPQASAPKFQWTALPGLVPVEAGAGAPIMPK